MKLASEMSTVRSLSVFDLDHTLIAGNSSFLYGRYLYRQGSISFYTMLCLVSYYFRHKIFGMSLLKLHRLSFRRLFLGKKKADIEASVEAFLNENFSTILNSRIVERLNLARADRHELAIFSSSPSILLAPIAERLHVKTWQATQYDADENGRFTLVSSVIEGCDKAKSLEKLRLDLSILPENVVAYSDCLLDVPFLESAGTAIGVRTAKNRRFCNYCKSRGWEVC